MRKFKVRKRLLACIGAVFALVLLVGGIIINIKTKEANAASSYLSYSGGMYGSGIDATHAFNMSNVNAVSYNIYGATYNAWCASGNDAAPAWGNYQVTEYDITADRNDNFSRTWKAIYYTKQNNPALFNEVVPMHWGITRLFQGWANPYGGAGSNTKKVLDNGYIADFPANVTNAKLYVIWTYSGVQNIVSAGWDVVQDVSIDVEKRWVDQDNKFNTRPGSVVFEILNESGAVVREVTVSAPNWKETVTGLPAGHSYSAREKSSSLTKGYTSKADGGTIVTNTLETTNINFEKVWEGEERDNATVCLRLNGVEQSPCQTVTSPWTGSFNNYPKYDANGNLIQYTIFEKNVPEGYKPIISSTGAYSFRITNKQSTSLTVIKRWVDNDNAIDARPRKITVYIERDGVQYDTIDLDESDKVDGKNEWRKDTNEYPVSENGHTYTYTVAEDVDFDCSNYSEGSVQRTTCESYVPSYSQFDDNNVATITNSLQGKTKLLVLKHWEDESNAHGDRPNKLIINVFADGRKLNDRTRAICRVAGSDSDCAEDSNTYYDAFWTDDSWYMMMELDKYDANGKIINYTVEEEFENDTIASHYIHGDPEIIDQPGNITISTGELAYDKLISMENKRQYSVNISVEKTWKDNDNMYNTRPNYYVVYEIYRSFNGSEPESTGYRIYVYNNNGNWFGYRGGLPKYPDESTLSPEEFDIPYTYSLVELSVTDSYKDNGCTLERETESTYAFTCENELDDTVNVHGTKVWIDNDNAYDTRPSTLSLKLYRKVEGENEELDEEHQPLWTYHPVYYDNRDDVWEYTYEYLPLYKDGKKISYRVVEDPVETGKEGFYYCRDIDNAYPNNSEYEFNFGNRLCGWVSFYGEKIWRYGTAPEDMKPEDITVNLYRNGELLDTTTAVDNGEGKWFYLFDWGYPKFDENGALYDYTWDEDAIEHYLTEYDGSTIYNTYLVDFTANKIWKDDGDTSHRPGYIKVTLYRDGEEFSDAILNNDNDWSYTWKDLDSNYEWTITEDIQVPGYAEAEYKYEYDDEGNIICTIFNAKAPHTLGQKISKYVLMSSGIALGGYIVSRRVFGRR